ncbi:MAG: tRNA (guanosine(37)-N1)-methyltransferase TrmD [Elusimicrobia bacterium]|nr:tRNA (guanosine(37)-N1)-methyltransferase TrmD [Elusimicrobiota bacterium]
MRFDIVTLFPGMFEGVFGESIVARALQSGLVEIGFVNPRDFSLDRHRKVDDRPFGGGPGMILMAEPLYRAIKSVRRRAHGRRSAGRGAAWAGRPRGRGSHVVFLSPQGRRFDARVAAELASREHVVLVCGHYEGVDERLRAAFDDEISIGDYVLTGGELPAMVVADAVARLVPGVLKKEEAVKEESFELREGVGLSLDHPHYTRPRVWRGKRVPAALLSGDHERIIDWRRRAATVATRRKRPDLIG